MARSGGIEIEGLSEFRRDLRRAADANPRVLTAGLKKAGQPIINRLRGLPPHRSGALASGYSIQARGSAASILNRVPYSGGAEWGSHGKWSGFMRYGPPGRFAWRAVDERKDQLAEDLAQALEEILTAYGWAT